jgi:hypothetical protein
VYGREYQGRELRFGPSGGVLHHSLVLQDKETDSYWSIMSGKSLAGEFEGTRLEELPLGIKIQWKDWRGQHPDTLVLSVEGVEYNPDNPYEDHLSSKESFDGSQADDRRLPAKEPVYAFRIGARPFAGPTTALEGGAVFHVDQHDLFLYRPPGAAIFLSTVAFRAPGQAFDYKDDAWLHIGSGARFDEDRGVFEGKAGHDVARLDGFDTFWFNWSMTHPDTEVLEGRRR